MERVDVERWCTSVETGLRDVGGPDLVADARREAEWYAALYFIWDGCGDEPTERLHARVRVMTLRLESARDADGPA